MQWLRSPMFKLVHAVLDNTGDLRSSKAGSFFCVTTIHAVML